MCTVDAPPSHKALDKTCGPYAGANSHGNKLRPNVTCGDAGPLWDGTTIKYLLCHIFTVYGDVPGLWLYFLEAQWVLVVAAWPPNDNLGCAWVCSLGPP